MKYCCKYCAKGFDNQRFYSSHIGTFHPKTNPIETKRKKYSKVFEKRCLYCDKSFFVVRWLNKDGVYYVSRKEKKCCSTICARKYSSSFLSKKIENERISAYCKKCGTKIEVAYNANTKNVCCNSCSFVIKKSGKKDSSRKYKISRFCDCGSLITDKNKSGFCRKCLGNSPEYKKKLSKSIKERVTNGSHKGWSNRSIISYPEKFFIKVLENNNLLDKCKINFPIRKRDLGISDNANYFLDFFFEEKKLDVEIDGKQHSYIERLESDKVRDELLKAYGIKVYRISWKNPINEINKKYIEEEIAKLLDILS